MPPEQDSSSNSYSKDAYLLLGLKPGSSFEVIQKARDEKLLEAGEDPIKKAQIEAAYDSLLMVSLKARQLGEISNAAISASKREDKNEIGVMGSSLLTRLKGLNSTSNKSTNSKIFPDLNLVDGNALPIRLALGALVLVMVFISPDASIELILSLSTIGLFISQVRRGRKFIPSLGWSIALLSIGLIIGSLIFGGSDLIDENIYSISSTKLESLPAFILIFLGTLLLD